MTSQWPTVGRNVWNGKRGSAAVCCFPCWVTRGFKKVRVNSRLALTAWENNPVCPPDCHSHLLSVSVWDSPSARTAGWLWMYICVCVCRYLGLCVCVSLSLCVCDPKEVRGQAVVHREPRCSPPNRKGGHCPYAVFTHTHSHTYTHLGSHAHTPYRLVQLYQQVHTQAHTNTYTHSQKQYTHWHTRRSARSHTCKHKVTSFKCQQMYTNTHSSSHYVDTSLDKSEKTSFSLHFGSQSTLR